MKCLLLFLTFLSFSAFGSNALPINFDHNHIIFDKLLSDHTGKKDGQTWVDYTKFKANGRADLQKYLRTLSVVTLTQYKAFTPDQKLAFLINAYNAFTLEWILIHHPVKSIKDTGSLFSSPWKKIFPDYTLLGQSFTLDNIEHDRIRVEFKEPRIHFAVNCASIGCPSLRSKAFTGSKLQVELAEAELAFFKNPGKFQVKNKVAYLSSILDWYGGDFEKIFGSVEAYVSERAKHYNVAGDLPAKNFKIIFQEYDWNLNGR